MPQPVRSLVALLTLATLGGYQCGCGMCGDEEVARVASPNGEYAVRTFVRNCGATTGYVTHVELTKTHCWLGCSLKPYVENGDRSAQAAWQAPTQLVISCNGCGARVAIQWGDVSIHYREP